MHIFQDRNTIQEKPLKKIRKESFQLTLTSNGNIEYRPIPINRPHDAPIKRLGIKRPELTIIPYVQQTKQK